MRPLTQSAEQLTPSALFDVTAFQPLSRDPRAEVNGTVGGVSYSATIAITHYGDRIAHHYRDTAPNGLAAACAEAAMSFDWPHFGLVVSFSHPVEVGVHNEDMVLDGSIGALIVAACGGSAEDDNNRANMGADASADAALGDAALPAPTV